MIVIHRSPRYLSFHGILGPRIVTAFHRDGTRCLLCGFDFLSTEDGIMYATVDHLVPRSRGGTASPENLVLACLACNSLKAGSRIRGTTRADKIAYAQGMVSARRKGLPDVQRILCHLSTSQGGAA